jgi:Post-segregation antitoxin CcdA
MRMTRVNITVPDEVAKLARAAGLNISRVATEALVAEIERRAKVRALDDYLDRLEGELGPISSEEQAEASRWADRILPSNTSDTLAEMTPRRSA